MWPVVMAAVLVGSTGVAPAAEASRWRPAPLPPKAGHDSFAHVTASGAKDIWAASGANSVLVSGSNAVSNAVLLERFDGRRWRPMPRPTGAITALSASSAGDVWALTSGRSHRWDGKGWRVMRSFSPTAHVLLAAVPGGAWVSEQGRLSRYDGTHWQPVPLPADFELGALRIQGRDVWVLGRYKSGKAIYDTIEGGSPAALRWTGRALARVPVTAPANLRAHLQIDDVVTGKGGDLWLSGHSVLDGDRLPVLQRRGSTWTTLTPPRTPPPENIEPDGAGGVWFDYGLDQPLWRNRAGKWTKVAAPKPPSGRRWGLFTNFGAATTAHIPGTTLLVRAGATSVPAPGNSYDPETSRKAHESADRVLMTGPHS
ncbi:hypothetical protein [Herbidospora yilanensis]|uniref:hypothetical protein n=1 Tax=Herbidospora yilanensis TaxID=354426 RepID=UPI000781F705|nr:hypothetical protein [Herbidospora yilanensis]